MAAFWSSVALMTGSYHGRPIEMDMALPIKHGHFTRWLGLFEEAAVAVCPPEGAAHVIERAHRIAHSTEMAIEDSAAPVRPPRLRPVTNSD